MGGRAAQRACWWQEDNPSHPPPPGGGTYLSDFERRPCWLKVPNWKGHVLLPSNFQS